MPALLTPYAFLLFPCDDHLASFGHACRLHAMRYVEPYYAITERFDAFGGVVMPEEWNTINRIALFHYSVKCVTH